MNLAPCLQTCESNKKNRKRFDVFSAFCYHGFKLLITLPPIVWHVNDCAQQHIYANLCGWKHLRKQSGVHAIIPENGAGRISVFINRQLRVYMALESKPLCRVLWKGCVFWVVRSSKCKCIHILYKPSVILMWFYTVGMLVSIGVFDCILPHFTQCTFTRSIKWTIFFIFIFS